MAKCRVSHMCCGYCCFARFGSQFARRLWTGRMMLQPNATCTEVSPREPCANDRYMTTPRMPISVTSQEWQPD